MYVIFFSENTDDTLDVWSAAGLSRGIQLVNTADWFIGSTTSKNKNSILILIFTLNMFLWDINIVGLNFLKNMRIS